MSEQINKVLASTAQAFSTSEQKQARDNIGAQASGDYVSASTFNNFSAHVESAKQDASAMSSYVPYSAISADSDSAITSINGSSVGKFTGVSANYNITGNGLSSSPLGVSDPIQLTASDKTAKYGSTNAVLSSNGFSTRVMSTAIEVNGNGVSSTARATGFRVKADLGGSYAYADYGVQGVTYGVPLPGWSDESAHFTVDGVRGVGNFGSNMYDDNWISAHRYQGTGDTGNGLWQDIGYFNGSDILRYPRIVMYVPGNSATIDYSSIAYWNNKMSSVNVGFGLSGNGKDAALGVTACSGEFIGLHSDYFYALTSRDLVFSSYDKDNSQLEAKTVFNEYGMRMSANTARRLVTLQDDGFRMASDASSLTASLDHAKLRMSNSSGYADLTKSSIDAIQAVYNWATSQGMTPLS